MDTLLLPPVGWGFMLLHFRDSGVIVTDGGAMPTCFGETLEELQLPLTYTFRIVPRHRKWVWILSHLDYDHYSITAAMVSRGFWERPSGVILPAVYSEKECREVLAKVHFISLLTASTLNLPEVRRQAPLDLATILAGSRRLAAMQGDKFRAGNLAYHILWPPPPSRLGRACKDILEELNELARKYKEKCRKERSHQFCERIVKKAESEADILKRVVEPNGERRYEPIEVDIDRVLEDEDHEEDPGATHNVVGETKTITPLDYNAILQEAAQYYDDKQLLKVVSVMNTFSLAYSLEHRDIRPVYGEAEAGIYYPEIIPIICYLVPWKYCYRLEYGHSCRYYPSITLYLSDLDGESLNKTLDYYIMSSRTQYPAPLIEVAPHHGNAYTDKLVQISPCIVYMARCDRHISTRIQRGFKYARRLQKLGHKAIPLQGGHTNKIVVHVWRTSTQVYIYRLNIHPRL